MPYVKKSLTAQERSRVVERTRYDDKQVPERDQVALKIEGKNVGTLGSFVCLSGLPKGGKSTFLQLTLASIYHPDQYGIALTPPAGRSGVLWIDSEHSDYEFYEVVQTVKGLMGVSMWPPGFLAHKVSDMNPDEIMDLVEYRLQENPSIFVVFIDTLLDLSNDFNSVAEAMKVNRWLKYIKKTFNVLVFGVIHLGKKNLQTLGHLGSLVDRWARAVMTVEKNKAGGYTMESKYQRGAAEFSPITVMRTQDGSIMQVYGQESEGPKKEFSVHAYQDTEHRWMMETVVEDEGSDYRQVVVDLSELKSISQVQAKKMMQYWIGQQWVRKRDGLYYREKNAKLFKFSLVKI